MALEDDSIGMMFPHSYSLSRFIKKDKSVSAHHYNQTRANFLRTEPQKLKKVKPKVIEKESNRLFINDVMQKATIHAAEIEFDYLLVG
jgi:hypothetical protein